MPGATSEPLYIPLPEELEDVEAYKPGGYHPVQIGDTYINNQYQILNKVGHGGLSTVWLARDHKSDLSVCVKILRADQSRHSKEVAILDHVRKTSSTHPGYKYLNRVLDEFEIEGPNGRHRCLVMPLAGPSVASYIDRRSTVPSDPAFAKRTALHASKGLAALHHAGIVHGDLTTSNILLQVAHMETWSDDDLAKTFGCPQTQPIKARHTRESSHAPPYAVWPLGFSKIDSNLLDGSAIMSDFSESFFACDPPQALGIPLGFAAPELLFDDNSRPTSAVDIWALACCIFNIRAGTGPFYPCVSPRNDVLQQMVVLLGKLPDPWWQAWESRSTYFEEDGTTGRGPYAPVELEDIPRRLREIGRWGPNGKQRPEYEEQRLDESEVEELGELLGQILVYEPGDRTSIRSVLESKWMRVESDDEKDMDRIE